ncbi:MAG: ATP-binding protein [Francisella endosymbiont of Hyalomma asiaticum]
MTIKFVEENKKLIVPTKNDKEIGLVETVHDYSFDSLNEIVEFLSGNEKEPEKPSIEINFAELYQDLEDVKGQYQVKRALEIAAADGHNILLVRTSWYWKNNASK